MAPQIKPSESQTKPPTGSQSRPSKVDPADVKAWDNAKNEASPGVVIVSRGQTLSQIARDNGIDLKKLYELNRKFDPSLQGRQDGRYYPKNYKRPENGGWDPDFIKPGDAIRVSEDSSTAGKGGEPQESAAAQKLPQGAPGGTPQENGA